MNPCGVHSGEGSTGPAIEDASQPDDQGAMAGGGIPLRRAWPARGAPAGCVERARTISGADATAILLYDRGRHVFMPAVPGVALGLDEQWLQRQGLEALQCLALRTLEHRDIVQVQDTSAMAALDFPSIVGQQRPGSKSRRKSSACSICSMPRPVPHRAARMCFVPSALAGLAIANIQARERERALRERMEALDRATKTIAAEASSAEVFQRIVELAASVSGAQPALTLP